MAEGHLAFICPGCKERHVVNVNPGRWTFNDNYDAPTLSPSILVRSGHYASPDKPCWCTFEERYGEPAPYKCYTCHSFVTDGKIQFLGDCTHELAGQTVELQDFVSE